MFKELWRLLTDPEHFLVALRGLRGFVRTMVVPVLFAALAVFVTALIDSETNLAQHLPEKWRWLKDVAYLINPLLAAYGTRNKRPIAGD